MNENALRELIAQFARSLFKRGYSVGTAGNLSVAFEDDLLITPTNSSLGNLDPAGISKISRDGRHLSGDRPSKEIFLHRAFYESRPATGAVVHLHSTFATAISCLETVDPDDCIVPLTPYVVMRVGPVKLLPYVRPGDQKMGEMIRDLRGRYAAVLLANHGSVVAARDLESAVYGAEELEETAKLLVLLEGRQKRILTQDQVDELVQTFGSANSAPRN